MCWHCFPPGWLIRQSLRLVFQIGNYTDYIQTPNNFYLGLDSMKRNRQRDNERESQLLQTAMGRNLEEKKDPRTVFLEVLNFIT